MGTDTDMHTLSASELLMVWERGRDQQPFQRAVALLAAANPELTPTALAELSIGERDAALLTLREWTFGPRVASIADCPSCGTCLDLAFDIADIRTEERSPPETVALSVAGYELRFRLPTSADIAALAAEQGNQRQHLLRRCLIEVRHAGADCDGDQLPQKVEAALLEHMAAADPQADVQLALTCPNCSQHWQAPFDIVSFFWSEIDVWAYATLREIHTLASAYGWREADILALSPRRRRIYLELIGT
jgi:hypothetical protein